MWVMDRLLADHAELKKKYDTLLEDYQKLVHKYEIEKQDKYMVL